jgi:hypothetical protein
MIAPTIAAAPAMIAAVEPASARAMDGAPVVRATESIPARAVMRRVVDLMVSIIPQTSVF